MSTDTQQVVPRGSVTPTTETSSWLESEITALLNGQASAPKPKPKPRSTIVIMETDEYDQIDLSFQVVQDEKALINEIGRYGFLTYAA